MKHYYYRPILYQLDKHSLLENIALILEILMFRGSIVALITPMTENGDVDFEEIDRLVEWHIECGTKGIVAMGTTAESCTLSWQEHVAVVKAIANKVNGRISVIAGNGSNCTREAVNATKELDSLPIDGYLTVTPYYNKPTQLGLQLHFEKVAECTSKPVILYNVPGRTACDLQPETVAKLAKIDNVVGIKEATGDLTRVKTLRELIPNDFNLLSGDDPTGLEFVELGGDGVISVTSNVAPAQMSKMFDLALASKLEEAKEIDEKLSLLHERLFVQPNPVPCKWILQKLNKIKTSEVRLPLVKMESSYESVVLEAIEHANLLG